jgi:hypothetical protein
VKRLFSTIFIVSATVAVTACEPNAGTAPGGGDAAGEPVGESRQRAWTEDWETLGANAQSGPAIVAWNDKQSLSAFWRGADNHLKHKWFPFNDDWSWEQDLGGNLTSDPAAVSWGGNRIDVFWKGTDGHLKHKWYPFNGDWSWEQDLGGNLTSDPAAVSKAPGELNVFWRGTDGHVKHKWYPFNNDWSWEQDLGGNLASGSSPGAASRGPGQLNVFWKGTDNHLKHKWYPFNNDWSWEQDLGGNLTSSPDATSMAPTRLDVVARGPGNAVMHQVWQERMQVPLFGQQTGQWCWAGVGQMIMAYHGINVAQCTQANDRLGRTDCCNSPTPNACVQPGWPEFERHGLSTTWTNWGTALTLSQAQAELNAGRPFAGVRDWGNGTSHIVSVIDYLRFDGDDFLVINDPSPVGAGDQYIETYNDFVQVPGVHTHGLDIYGIRPSP